jgi:ribosomal protein L21E
MAKNSDFRVGDHIIVIKPCDYEGERGVVTKITDDRVYIQLDDEYEPLDDSFYDEDLNWDYEMLQETAAKRYPKGTVFRFEEVDSWRTAYDPKQFHVPNEGTLFAEPGNGVLFRHGAWAKVKGEDASKHISKFKVGDVVHLIESKKGVSPGPQIITEVLPDRYYHINGMKGQDWMGEFHEDWFTLLKFKVGDIVIGNAKADQYNITTEGWKGRVIGVTDDYFTVVGLDGGSEYAVEYDCFDLFVEPMPADENCSSLWFSSV